jgi:hypothetical protein
MKNILLVFLSSSVLLSNASILNAGVTQVNTDYNYNVRDYYSGKCLDVAENKDAGVVSAHECYGDVDFTYQNWSFSDQPTSQNIVILNMKSGKCLDVSSNKIGGQVVIQSCYTDASNTFQEWDTSKSGYIRNIKSGLCLDIGNKNKGLSKVILSQCSEKLGTTRKWVFDDLSNGT